MKIAQKKYDLPNGEIAIIKSAGADDALKVKLHREATSAETHFMARYPEDGEFNLERIANVLKTIEDSERDFMVSAYIGDEMIGDLGVTLVRPHIKYLHRGYLGMSIRQKYTGMGLGSFMMKVALEQAKLSFKLPGVVLAASFCFYATGFTPSLYSMGHAGLGRTQNAVKLTFQILMILNEIYFVGWLKTKIFGKDTLNGEAGEQRGTYVWNFLRNCPWFYYVGLGVLMLLTLKFAPNKAGVYSTYGAFYYVHTGEAYNFRQEYLARVEMLEGEDKNVVLEPYHFTPWLICMGDLSTDPDAEENVAVASWYDKDSVVVREIENELQEE